MKTAKEYSTVEKEWTKDEQKRTYEVKPLGEWWCLPELFGTRYQRFEAEKVRFVYMKELKRQLKEYEDRGAAEEMLVCAERAKRELDHYLGVGYWLNKRKLYKDVVW